MIDSNLELNLTRIYSWIFLIAALVISVIVAYKDNVPELHVTTAAIIVTMTLIFGIHLHLKFLALSQK